MGDGTEREDIPRMKDFAPATADSPPAPRHDLDAQYRSMVLETTFLVPFGFAMLTGVAVFLGPYLLGRLSAPVGELTRLERFFTWTGSHPVLVIGAVLLICLLILVAVRTEPARRTFLALGSAAPLVFKLGLFVPIVATVALLLLTIVSPVLKALSGLP